MNLYLRKKMFFKYVILIAYLLIHSNLGQDLTNHDFCLKQNGECSGKFKYECKHNKCSPDKTACVYFNSLIFTLNFYKKRNTHLEEIRKFSEFQSRISKCPIQRHEWKKEDYCLNFVGCASIDFSVKMPMWKNKHIAIRCPCTRKHPYECDKNICALNKNACHNFKNKTINLLKKISKCNKKANSNIFSRFKSNRLI